MTERKKVHEVTVTIKFDKPVTARQARYAAWNHLQQEIYGTDDPENPDSNEPYGEAQVSVKL